MAIVFDTQAELEAFCEAFELREVRQKPFRKTRQRLMQSEYLDETTSPTLSLAEEQPSVEELVGIAPADIEVMPITDFIDEPPIGLAS